jgi:antitoxin ParD1/3/4
MDITLTTEQAQLVQQKLQSGQYHTVDDLLTQAFQLLEEWDEHSMINDLDWIESTQPKVDAAIRSLETKGGNDGEAVVNHLLDKFRQARES